MANKWKVIAIIFIVLFILETIFLIWAWNYGTETIENEYECSVDICQDAEAFIYYEYEEVCDCYIDNEIVLTKYMGGK